MCDDHASRCSGARPGLSPIAAEFCRGLSQTSRSEGQIRGFAQDATKMAQACSQVILPCFQEAIFP